MKAGPGINRIGWVFFALAILYCLLPSKWDRQLGAWQADVAKETIIQKARYFKNLEITKPIARSILTVWETPSSYDQLMTQARLVVLGRFRDQKCRLSGDRMHIETVCAFSADRVISGRIDWSGMPAQNRVLPEAEMQPLRDNEIFVIRLGGKLELFGVQMQENETAFPAFKNKQTYILFLHVPPGFSENPGYYGQPQLNAYETINGPHSVMKVDKGMAGEPRIEPLVNNLQLRNEVEVKFHWKLSLFLEHFKKG
jgi:hypothetical protein